ncbi:UNVERIFIED_CONTAM: hypothetical protein HDU68_011990 [Siphonaria sp. JEL0065]|nr:hypothetical protein HDU68_011990 [Siphonaria sp. JEL0065]
MSIVAFTVEPPLGSSISVPISSDVEVRVIVVLAAGSTSRESPNRLSVELWTNHSSSNWHSVPMVQSLDASSVVVCPSLSLVNTSSGPREVLLFIAQLKVTAAFEFTARVVCFESGDDSETEVVAFEEGRGKTSVFVNGGDRTKQLVPPNYNLNPLKSIIAWLNKGGPSANAAVGIKANDSNSIHSLFKNVHSTVTLHDLPLDQHTSTGVQFAGSITSESLDSILLQLTSHQTSTFTLNRRNQHWLEPGFGASGWPESSRSREVSLALWNVQTQFSSVVMDQPLYAVLIPTPPHIFQMKEDGKFQIAPTFSAHMWPHDYKSNPVRAFLAVSKDPVEAVQFLVKLFRKTTPAPASSVSIESPSAPSLLTDEESTTSTLNENNASSAALAPARYYDRLGWCTWNSFYRDVSEQGIETGLQKFKENKIKISWLLIDDGWQNVDSDLRFQSFGLNEKFPSGYSLIKKLKHEYNLSHVAVWHSLVGYWGGISSKGDIAAQYKLREITRRGLATTSTTHVVDSSAYSQYYNDFHKPLKEAGIDFFKVDDQSVFEAYTETNAPNELMSKYQETLVQESKTTPVIWCMAHNMEVLYQTLTMSLSSPPSNNSPKRTFRASDDFYPDDPNSHTWHIQSNSSNSLLLGNLSPSTLMDWDMFQSSHPYAEFHAISRALSNGPVYLSDVVGQHDLKVVEPLLADDGRVVRVHENENACAAMPLPKSLLADVGSGNGLLFVEAHGGGSGCAVLGVFNCARSEVHGSVSDVLVPSRDLVRNTTGGGKGLRRRNSDKLAVLFYKSDQVVVVNDSIEASILVQLGQREADVLTICPFWKSKSGTLIACFGLADKYYGAAAVKGIDYEDVSAGGVRVRLDAAFTGKYFFYSVVPSTGAVQTHVVECQEGVKKWYLVSVDATSDLTYFGVHCIYTIPPIAVLAFLLHPFITRTDVYKIVALSVVAILYTSLWDNYIVAMGAWTYAPEKVLGVIGYVPVSVLFGRLTLVGLHMAVPKTDSFYLGALIAWTGPVLSLQWWVAGPFIWSLRKPVTLTLAVSTLYLWIVDHTAIKHGVWEISNSGITGYMVTPHLPLEEALFFFLVNCMIVFGLLAMDRTFAIIRVMESRVAGRGGRFNAFSLDYLPQAYPSSTTASLAHDKPKWKVMDEINLWVHYTFMNEIQINQEAVKDLQIVHQLICAHSKTFSLASKLYPQPLREDIVALYGFCRVSDDVADTLDSQGVGAREWKEKCTAMIEEFVHVCYKSMEVKENRDRLKVLIHKISAGLVEFPTSADSESAVSVLRLFSQRVPRCIPKECILELLIGYKWDLAGRKVKTEEDLLEYSGYVASSVGEACVYLMLRHDVENSFSHAVESINNPYAFVQPTKDTLQRARDMGLALQLTNIARDLITDADELGRAYIPYSWFYETQGIDQDTDPKAEETADRVLRQRKLRSSTPDITAKSRKSSSEDLDLNTAEILREGFITDPRSSPEALKIYSRRLVVMAKPLGESAMIGIRRLPRAHRSAVKAALKMYMRIGQVIVESDEYPRRAIVSFKEKLLILAAGLYS